MKGNGTRQHDASCAQLDRDKRITLLRWLKQGYIQRTDMQELTCMVKTITNDVVCETRDQARALLLDSDMQQEQPNTIPIDHDKRITLLRWLKRGYLDVDEMPDLMRLLTIDIVRLRDHAGHDFSD